MTINPGMPLALKLMDATKQSLENPAIAQMAVNLIENYSNLDEETFASVLLLFAKELVSFNSAIIVGEFMSEEEIRLMMDEVKEFEEIGKGV
jgi:hypothetical protein